ncbi:N-acetyltransferase [Sphingomonas sp. QA11]|uniref:GNAT family N-acetyltransferase n=1 Tax=Sphingomonas sp. QA11 TaxID=2950605 RepID=UPI0023499193|nr:GNAT family N-acetyltransferase [Sphingomonas sp. QA11]WCM28616.1 N-acetyltransferase [Sphingomonas sp. QA11]
MILPVARGVVRNMAQHRFELPIEGADIAAAYYQTDDEGRLILIHSEVPSEYSGRGIGSALARGVFDFARAEGLKLVLRCPFMNIWFARHPDYGDVVDG